VSAPAAPRALLLLGALALASIAVPDLVGAMANDARL
jgi:hypothetical protein